MITHTQLFQLYQAKTGSTVYRITAVPAGNQERWQRSRVQEYAFRQDVR